ncbi:MAG: hypothetical protein Q9168_006693 [Polycauliona sp. 1 TL-2023]
MAIHPQDGNCGSDKIDPRQAPGIQTLDPVERPETIWKYPVIPDAVTTFRKAWHDATDDNYLTLFGFRRFRTAHLLNLRFLEQELDKIDHQIFQAGLSLDNSHKVIDRLALKQAKRDGNMEGRLENMIDDGLSNRLRCLLKQYDEALASFNSIMMMETFALADHSLQSERRNDLNEIETFKTRLVRVDLARRDGPRDILRHCFRKVFRYFWFFIRQKRSLCHAPEAYDSAAMLEANLKRRYQNTARIAECMTRFVVAMLAGAFLVVPLVILSHESEREAQLVTVSVCIIIFSLLVSLVSKASNEQTMVASAGYAAVLVVFLSNNPQQ